MKYTITGLAVCFVLSVASICAQELEGEIMLKSFQHVYPDKVEAVAFIDGDWTIKVGDALFYWSHGRLLPPELRHNWEEYRSQMFSVYPKDIPDPADYSPETLEALQAQGAREARLDMDDPYMGFQSALYGGSTRTEIETHQVKAVFLGKNIVIHEDIVEPLSRVEQQIKALAQENREIAEFVTSLDSIGGYNWRPIQGTRRQSYHSWGLALDIQPKQLGNKVMYWFWERIFNSDWMAVPRDRRWIPPAEVIRAFENEGFIWGGRWALYDNMHFEYRPELLEANRLLAVQAADVQPSYAENAPDLHHLYPGNVIPPIPFWERLLIYLGLKK
ncbi:MAG: M15 family metallopeptidase [Spirochaetaceae bacterium]|jgi:hypothetical protein|nr:M15 family metallopeptidase [Spirochaetaceae bacterium]